MKKTFYIAGKVGASEEEVARLRSFLEEAGYVSIFDWSGLHVKKPYLVHIHENAPIAEAMMKASDECDIFVLLVGGDLYMAMSEYGAALNARRRGKEKDIYVVLLSEGSRQSLAFAHEHVLVCHSLAELYRCF